jgi:hypothetical protein
MLSTIIRHYEPCQQVADWYGHVGSNSEILGQLPMAQLKAVHKALTKLWLPYASAATLLEPDRLALEAAALQAGRVMAKKTVRVLVSRVVTIYEHGILEVEIEDGENPISAAEDAIREEGCDIVEWKLDDDGYDWELLPDNFSLCDDQAQEAA